MTRYLYGGGGDGDIIQPSGLPYINAPANVFNARTGGTQITDLQNMFGSGITSVTTDSVGQAIFYGPDNFISVLWLDFGSGVRWALSPKAVDLAATQAVSVQRAGDAASPSHTTKSSLPYSVNDPLEQALANALDPLVIPRFASQSARDAAFLSPVSGDRCYRTDLDALQSYSGGAAAWQTAYMFNQGTGVSSVTVTNKTAETALTSFTVPPNYATVGATFRLTAVGTAIQAASTTPSVSFRIRVGGVTGTAFATNTYTAANQASPTPRPWRAEALVTVLTTGSSGTWFGNLTSSCVLGVTGTLPTITPALRTDGTVAATRSTLTAQSLVLTAQWDTASTSNTCVMYGFAWERLC